MPHDTILIPEEMDQLRAHIRAMSELRRQRVGQLSEMQIELDDLCKTLEEEPQLEVERFMLMDDPANIQLSDDNMDAVARFMERLQTKLAANKERKQAMEAKIQVGHRIVVPILASQYDEPYLKNGNYIERNSNGVFHLDLKHI